MDVLGLTGVQAVIFVVISGVLVQNVVGWLKSGDSFNIRQSAASAIIAIIGGFAIVGPAIEAIGDVSEEAKLIIVVALIGSVAGFDTLAKGSFKVAKRSTEED